MNMKKCVVCGKEFKPKKGTQKCCCPECSNKYHANYQKAKRDNCKKLHICTRCGMPIDEKNYKYFECVSCREKHRASRNKNRSVAQQDKLSAALCEIDRYNELNSTHLTYGQYIIKKERGEIK